MIRLAIQLGRSLSRLVAWLRRMLWTLLATVVLFLLWGTATGWLIAAGGWWAYTLACFAGMLFVAAVVALNRFWHAGR
jgi:hypothetical protein